MILKVLKVSILISLVLVSCKRPTKETNPSVDPSEALSGGIGTSFDAGEQGFNHSIGNLDAVYKIVDYGKGVVDSVTLLERFKLGNSDFRTIWVAAGNTTTARDGLGPIMNATNCSACHVGDGRGLPDPDNGLVLRLSVEGTNAHGGPNPEPTYGEQLQHRAIFGTQPEGDIQITYEEIAGMFSDKSEYSLRKPTYTISNLAYGALAANTMVSPRVGRQVIGLGLLENIPEADILANADEFDADGDYISGKANYVWDISANKTTLGRFGWKANQPNIRQQNAGAFNGDIGLTSTLFPDMDAGGTALSTLEKLLNGGTPEVSDSIIDEIAFYQRCLAVPARRNINNPSVIAGKKLFTDIGCAKCHKETFITGNSDIPNLANQTIHPYSDMLLHDMGSGLADHRPDYLANGNEWRTPPLWGIGLIKVVNKHSYLLHDGRARSIQEAILWHGGEALSAKSRFVTLSKEQRQQLLDFLENL